MGVNKRRLSSETLAENITQYEMERISNHDEGVYYTIVASKEDIDDLKVDLMKLIRPKPLSMELNSFYFMGRLVKMFHSTDVNHMEWAMSISKKFS